MQRLKSFLIVPIVIFLILIPVLTIADEIYLLDGSIIKGEITKVTDSYITIDIVSNTLDIEKNIIDKVIFEIKEDDETRKALKEKLEKFFEGSEGKLDIVQVENYFHEEKDLNEVESDNQENTENENQEKNLPEYFQFNDAIELSTGDNIFGAIIKIKESSIILESYISTEEVPFNKINKINFHLIQEDSPYDMPDYREEVYQRLKTLSGDVEFQINFQDGQIREYASVDNTQYVDIITLKFDRIVKCIIKEIDEDNRNFLLSIQDKEEIEYKFSTIAKIEFHVLPYNNRYETSLERMQLKEQVKHLDKIFEVTFVESIDRDMSYGIEDLGSNSIEEDFYDDDDNIANKIISPYCGFSLYSNISEYFHILLIMDIGIKLKIFQLYANIGMSLSKMFGYYLGGGFGFNIPINKSLSMIKFNFEGYIYNSFGFYFIAVEFNYFRGFNGVMSILIGNNNVDTDNVLFEIGIGASYFYYDVMYDSIFGGSYEEEGFAFGLILFVGTEMYI